MLISTMLSFSLVPSCQKNKSNPPDHPETQTSHCANVFDGMERARVVHTGEDSLFLNPFELFSLMTFKGLSFGVETYIDMKPKGVDTLLLFSDTHTNFRYDNIFDEKMKWSGDEIQVNLPTVEGNRFGPDSLRHYLRRSVFVGKEYKVIFSYRNDDDVTRTNIPTEMLGGYYIIDILEPGMKFERQKDFNY